MKKLSAFLVLSCLISTAAVADSRSGTIASWFTNVAWNTTGPCIQMSPVLTGSGYGCLLTSSYNCGEIVAALLATRLSGQAVTVW